MVYAMYLGLVLIYIVPMIGIRVMYPYMHLEIVT